MRLFFFLLALSAFIPKSFAQNEPPVFSPVKPQAVEENRTLNVDILATDPEGDAILLTAEGLPPNATFTDNGDGSGRFSFSPNFEQAGDFQITILATDDGDPVAEASLLLFVSVIDVNRRPIINAAARITLSIGEPIELPITALDPDGDPVTLTAQNLPGDATLIDNGDGSGEIVFTPTPGDVGTHNVLLSADDSRGGVSTATLEIIVLGEEEEEEKKGCQISGPRSSGLPSLFFLACLGVWRLFRRRAGRIF